MLTFRSLRVLSLSFLTLFLGTLISAFAVFCCGKHGYEKNIVACLYNLLAAILQSATILLLVGWIWSVRWGILFIQLSGICMYYVGKKSICGILFFLYSYVRESLRKNISIKFVIVDRLFFFFVIVGITLLKNSDDLNA